MNDSDTRNVIDDFKGKPHKEIVDHLDKNATGLEIAIENLTRDYNMGTIVRSANAFGVRTIHIIGSRQWNKRGAMMTDKYLEVVYHENVEAFVDVMKQGSKRIVCVDNVKGATKLSEFSFTGIDVLVFGAEGPGLSEEMLHSADGIVEIEQFGSTRSINVGVAAGIVMYEWLRARLL